MAPRFKWRWRPVRRLPIGTPPRPATSSSFRTAVAYVIAAVLGVFLVLTMGVAVFNIVEPGSQVELKLAGVGHSATIPGGTIALELTDKASEWSLVFLTGLLVGTTVVYAVFTVRLWQSTRGADTREATDRVWQQWWSQPLEQLRQHFYEEFIPYRAGLLVKGVGMKSAKDRIDLEARASQEHSTGDQGKTLELCYFFDKVGWLGARGLIDVDYILGPMQHVMRRVWIATEELIVRERHLLRREYLDPVYQFGQEWLFLRSTEKSSGQAGLVRRAFAHPQLRRETELGKLQLDLRDDEMLYRARLLQDIASKYFQKNGSLGRVIFKLNRTTAKARSHATWLEGGVQVSLFEVLRLDDNVIATRVSYCGRTRERLKYVLNSDMVWNQREWRGRIVITTSLSAGHFITTGPDACLTAATKAIGKLTRRPLHHDWPRCVGSSEDRVVQ